MTISLMGAGQGQNGPSNTNLAFSSGGDTNGLIYWLGTNGYTQGFSNPAGWNLGVNRSSVFSGSHEASNCFDRVSTSSPINFWASANQATGWILWGLTGTRRFKITKLTLQFITPTLGIRISGDAIIQGSNDGTNWATIGSLNLGQVGSYYISSDFSNSNFYRDHRIFSSRPSNSTLIQLGDIECYGELQL